MTSYKQYRMPTHRILAEIRHQETLISEAQDNLRTYNNILAERQRMTKHRHKLNATADLYINGYGYEVSDNMVRRIQADFQQSPAGARQIAEIIRKRVKVHDMNKRNAQIVLLSEHLSHSELATKFKLSRQQIHNIVTKGKSDYF